MDKKDQCFLKGLMQKNPVFLFGNGINSVIGKRDAWKKLVLKLLKEKNAVFIPYVKNGEISITSAVNLLDLEKSSYRTDIAPLVKNNFKKSASCQILDCAYRHKAQILTTNFDHNIKLYFENKNNINLDLFQFSDKNKEEKKNGDYRYYWNRFWGTKDIKSDEIPMDESRIWHIHGLIHNEKSHSVVFSFSKYISAVVKAKNIGRPKPENWAGRNTWLKLFYESPLIIAGWGGGDQELLLNYLLIERARLRKKNEPSEKVQDCLLVKREKKRKDAVAFLEVLGFKIIYFDSYEDIYTNQTWRNL